MSARGACLFVVCFVVPVLSVSAQIDVSLFSDHQCSMPLAPTALLFNSVQAWSSLSSSQLVPTTYSVTGAPFPAASNLTTQSCQSTAALQAAGVGVGVYSCGLPTSVRNSNNRTIVLSGVIALAEWPAASVSSCPAQLTAAPQQIVLYYLTPGNGSSYACELGFLTTNSSTTEIYAIVHKTCQATPNHASHVTLPWYWVLLLQLMVVWMIVKPSASHIDRNE